MATISEKVVVGGYCPVDKDDVSIEVEYISIPLPTDDRNTRTFLKGKNCCYYLSQGKCNLNNDCEIYKEAEARFTKNVDWKTI